MVSFPIQRGLQASRSKIVYFKHNDVEDFKGKLEKLDKLDRVVMHIRIVLKRHYNLLVFKFYVYFQNPKQAKATRRFCVVEGIYMKSGDMSPLNEITHLCRTYKVRLFVDETVSFGVLGNTGRGITEHLGVDVILLHIHLSNMTVVVV